MRTVSELESRTVQEQQERGLAMAKTGLEDPFLEDSSWEQIKAPAVAVDEDDCNMIRTLEAPSGR